MNKSSFISSNAIVNKIVSVLFRLDYSIGNLKQLQSICLKGNAIKKLPGSITQLNGLKNLEITHDKKLTDLPSSIGDLKNLESLIISNSKLKEIPEDFSRLSSLKTLEISSNKNIVNIPEGIGKLENLISLNFTDCSFKVLPKGLGELSNLAILDIWSNDELACIPDDIGRLSNLITLNICCNFELVSIPDSISQLSNLTSIKMFNNQINKISDNIGLIKKLENLDLSGNKLSILPESIGKLSNLISLHISSNELSEIPDSIGQLSNLKELYIGSNKLTSLPESIGDLKNLKILELYSNKLKSFPESIIGMENLESIEISDNPLKNMSKPILDFLQNLGVYSDEVDESDSSTSSVSNENDTSTFLQVNGYGVETFAGTVEAATYQYFEDNDIDLEDYSNDAEWGDDNCQVPEEHNFGGGGLYEVDNLWHVNGAYLTEDTQIELVNGSEDTIWSSNCDTESLESQGIKLICVSSQEDIFDSLDLKTVVMIGRIFQQGCTFENQLQDIENFDPNNLTIYYHEDESGRIIKKIEYDDTELENGDSSTSGSGSEYSWEVIG